MTETPSIDPGPARPAAPAAGPLLPGRIGLMLAQPREGLRLYEIRGGGVRDAAWLVLLGLLCFRLEDVTRALLGITHLSFGTVIRQMLAVLSQEVQEAIIVVLPAALAVTVAAGRGKRDPSRDLELGAAAYIPFFAARSVYRAADLPALLGPLPPAFNQVASVVALLWAAGIVVLGISTARQRSSAPADPTGPLQSSLEPVPLPAPGLRARLAVTGLGALAGAALAVNGAWVARNADAIRPLARGKDAPDFRLPRLDGPGGTLALGSLKGKVVLLDFWANWCSPCVAMLPTLHGIHEDWQARGVQLVGVHGPNVPAEEIQVTLRNHTVGYPMLLDADGHVNDLYKVVALPHLVLIGRDGTVLKTFWGVTSRREIESVLAAAVAVPP